MASAKTAEQLKKERNTEKAKARKAENADKGGRVYMGGNKNFDESKPSKKRKTLAEKRKAQNAEQRKAANAAKRPFQEKTSSPLSLKFLLQV